MSLAPPAPAAIDAERYVSGVAARVAAGLEPAQRLAFGRWVMAVFGLVAHLECCVFGCTAERFGCREGLAAVTDEQEQWEAWTATTEGMR